MRILFLLVVLSVTSALQSQVVIKENAIQSKYAFPLVTSKAKAVVVYDTDDYLVVRKTAELFVSDVESVTGQQLRLTDKLKGDKEIIIVGTVEKNRLIRQLAEKGKLDISSLEGAWERFLIQTVSRPFPGVSKGPHNNGKGISYQFIFRYLIKCGRNGVHGRCQMISFQSQQQLAYFGIGTRADISSFFLECLGSPRFQSPVFVI